MKILIASLLILPLFGCNAVSHLRRVHRVYCAMPNGAVIYDGTATGVTWAGGFLIFYPETGARKDSQVVTSAPCITTPFNESIDQRSK